MRKALAAFVSILTVAIAAGAHARLDPVEEDYLRRHVEILASEEFMGRETGEDGIGLAEEYIRDAFHAFGLRPWPGQGDYHIDYMLYRRAFDRQRTGLHIEVEGRVATGDVGRNFRPFPFSNEGSAELEVVFVGYGITAPEYDHDDYVDLDVQGKIVFMFRHEPGERDPGSVFDGSETTSHSLFTTKAQNAQDHGAAGMLLVTDPLNHGEGDDFRSGTSLRLDPEDFAGRGRDEDVDEEPFLAAHISRPLAETIVSGTGSTLSEIQRALDEGARPSSFALGDVRTRLSVSLAEEPEEVPARNMAGYLEGSDPKLRDEIVIVGGHHDHLGGYAGSGDTAYNGADDNASGAAGVLEMARLFGGAGERPKRSLLFVTFSGEEKGLLGSRALVEQDLVPLDRVRFMLNLDMVGRNPGEPMEVIGDGFAQGLTELVETLNEETRVDIALAGSAYSGNSDHHSFYRNDIPFLFFFTGIHEDYHQLGDHAEKLDYERMARIVTLAGNVVSSIADAETAPDFIHHVGWLGARIEILPRDGKPGAVVTSLARPSRGAKAGLSEGDVIVAVDGQTLEDPHDIGKKLRNIDPGVQFVMEAVSGGESKLLTCERARRGFLGVAPGPLDDDERSAYGLASGDGFLIRQVTPGGPSEDAGLRSGDILVRLDGENVGLGSLRRLLSRIGAGETVSATVIRDGDWLEMKITLGERPRVN